MSQGSHVLQRLGCFHLDLARLLISDLHSQDAEQVLDCARVAEEGLPARWNVCRDRVIESLVQEDSIEIKRHGTLHHTQRLEKAFS